MWGPGEADEYAAAIGVRGLAQWAEQECQVVGVQVKELNPTPGPELPVR
jgi:hypothetical protein